MRGSPGGDPGSARSAPRRTWLAGLLLGSLWFALTGPARGQCETAKMLDAAGQVGDGFGSAIDQRNTLAVFGAPGARGTGAAFVYRRDGDGWRFEEELVPADGQPGDQFGAAVATAMGVITVGARKHGALGIHSGAAYVFEFDGSQWNQTAKLLAPDGEASDHFGHAVAMSGNKIHVSSYLDDDSARNAGAVHVFRRPLGAWIHTDKILPLAPEIDGQFGFSLAASQEVLVVGSHGPGLGDADVFRFGQGRWSDEGSLRTTASLPGDEFGFAVDVHDDLAIVGAPRAGGSGAAYVFRHDGAVWRPEAALAATSPRLGDRFGHSVAIRPRRAAVGAPLDDAPALASGAVTTFLESGGMWNPESLVTAADGAARDQFGVAVALEQGTLLAGARHHDATATDAGAAYSYLLSLRQAAWASYGSGWPGARGVPALQPTADPVLDTKFSLTVDNSALTGTRGVMLIGLDEALDATPFDGTILVDWVQLRPIRFNDTNPLSIPVTLPCDSTLLGVSIYLQCMILDFGATQNVSFTRGLRLDIGL